MSAAWQVLDAAVLGPLRRSMPRTALAIFAIACGVALGFAVFLINRSAADEVSLAARSLFGLADLAIQASGDGFDEMLYPRVARLPEIAAVSPVVEVQAQLRSRRGTLDILGVDALRSRHLEPALASMVRQDIGAVGGTLRTDAIVLSASAARELNLQIGDKFALQRGLDELLFEVAAILPEAALQRPVGILDIATAQWRFDALGKLDRINIRLRAGADVERVRARLQELLPISARLVTPGEASDDALRLSRAYRSNLTALAMVALFTGGFLVYSTQTLAMLRRRREFALLHALGVTRRQQAGFALLSGAFVGVLGAALGVVLGALLGNYALQAVGADLGAGYFSGLTPQLRPQPWEALAFCVLGATVAVIASVQPAIEAARIPTASALKAGDVEAGKVSSHPVLIGVLLASGVALLFVPPIDGVPVAGYCAIALLIVASIVAMSATLRGLLRALPATHRVPLDMAVAYLQGTSRYAALSVCAIVVSFSLMVAMLIMVNSFRHSLDLWTQRVLPADVYVRAGYTDQSAFIDAATVQRLQSLPGVERTLASRLAQVSIDSRRSPSTLIARPIDAARLSEELWIQQTSKQRAPPDTTAIWISEATADLYALEPGATTSLRIAGRRLSAFVQGVWRDYEHQNGAVLMDRAAYVAATGDEAVNTVGLWLAEGATEASVVQAVRAALPSGAAYGIAVPRELRRMSLQVFDRTFAVTYILEAIAILIGLFGISASTSAQVLARRAEFGVLRHIGMARRQIGAMLASEGAILGSAGVLAGLVSGVAVGLILIYVVNRQSFHWSMDLFIPWPALATLCCVLIAASALIAWSSGRGAMSTHVVRAVKEDW